MSAGSRGWGLVSEMNFLSYLGTHSETKVDRAELLASYIEASDKREDWGSMDKDAVLSYANQQLVMCNGKGAAA